jgi:hypothetical protein
MTGVAVSQANGFYSLSFNTPDNTAITEVLFGMSNADGVRAFSGDGVTENGIIVESPKLELLQ